ncbi:uncharacterized protein [Amphiura filiformis]|uniref:uncharacterized protein n=1 Tax=Amphiura filiformis TaxID=82378 RepID=UPI003B2122CD
MADEATMANLRSAVASGRTDIVRSFITDSSPGGAAATAGGQKSGAVDPKLANLVNNVHPQQGTMLHMASKLGNTDVVRALLISGADPSIHNEQGKTAIDIAANPQVTRVFFDVMLQGVAQSNIPLVTNILNAGVDVNGMDDDTTSNTALHYAASYGTAQMVKLLGERKASINVTNADGATPLHDAVGRSDVGIIKELITLGADTTIKATKGKFVGKTPIDIVQDKPAIKAILEKRAAVPNGHVNANGAATANGEPSESDTSSVTGNGLTSPQTPGGDIDQLSESLLNTRVLAIPEVQVVLEPRLQMLWPRPQRIIENDGPALDLGAEFCIQLIPGALPEALPRMVDIWSVHISLLTELGYHVFMETGTASNSPIPKVVCQICPHLFPRLKEAYRLTVTEKEVKIQASDFSGLWYGACTLNQLIRLCRTDGIPQIHITDWPDIQYRGLTIDVSDGRILRLEHLMYLVNIVTFLKYNQLHLYVKCASDGKFESTMPYLQSELLDLDVYCRWRFMMLIPHLDLEKDGSLTTKEINLLRQLLTCFGSSSLVNLGPILTRKLIEMEHPDYDGPTPFCKGMTLRDKLSMIGVRHDQVVLFCSNELKTENAELVLPPGSIFMHYGSKMDCNFESPGKQLTALGQCFYACPATAAWNSFGGFPEAAIGNIFKAVQCAATYPSCIGLLVTDWSGHVFTNQPTISWPAFVTAAGTSWNKTMDMEFVHNRLPELINNHVFLDGNLVLGQAVIELGRVETFLTRAARNQLQGEPVNLPPDEGSFMCRVVCNPDNVDLEYITPEVVQKAIRHLRKCHNVLTEIVRSPLNDFAISELLLTADLLLWASRIVRALVLAGKKPDGDLVGAAVVNVGLNNVPVTAKTDCANKLLELIERYRQVWLMTSHSAGLADALNIFMNILHQLVPQQPMVVTAH